MNYFRIAFNRKLSILIIVSLVIFNNSSESAVAVTKKIKTIKVDLPSGSNFVAKGTKAQLFKIMSSEDKKRDLIEIQLDLLESCSDEVCNYKSVKANGSFGSNNQITFEEKTEIISKLEMQVQDSEKIISVITKSLYSKAGDASMLSPLTKQELSFFVSEVQTLTDITLDQLRELESGKNETINKYFANFENSYMYKANYSVEMVNTFFKNALKDRITFYAKVSQGFKNLISTNNKDKISEINITPIQDLEDLIKTTELNMKENLKL